jgi:hypothetical protein
VVIPVVQVTDSDGLVHSGGKQMASILGFLDLAIEQIRFSKYQRVTFERKWNQEGL